jgi:hypothetical protein
MPWTGDGQRSGQRIGELREHLCAQRIDFGAHCRMYRAAGSPGSNRNPQPRVGLQGRIYIIHE